MPSTTKATGSTSTIAVAPERAEQLAQHIADRHQQFGRLLADFADGVAALLDQTPVEPAAGLALNAGTCRQLEDLLGLGATFSQSALVSAVDRLGAIRIGDIRIPFTPGQLSELQHRAAKRGRTVDMEMRAVVARIEEELFYKGG